MEFKIVPLDIKRPLVCEHVFFCTANGNISESMISGTEKMVAKINRKYDREILRMDHSDMSALMSEQARSEQQIRVYVPDETQLTLKTMQYLIDNLLMVIDPLLGAKEIKVRIRQRMKFSNGKGGYEYHRVEYDAESDQYNFTRIYPLSDEEYAQMIAELREGKDSSIMQRFDYNNEADLNRFAPWYVQMSLDILTEMLKDKMPIFVEPHSYDFAQFMQALHCSDQLQDVDFDEEACLDLNLHPDGFLDTPEKRRAYVVEDYLGLWLGEYIHAHNADWEWRDRTTEQTKGEYHRLVLRNLQTMKTMNPMGMIHQWIQNRDDSAILQLNDQLMRNEIVGDLDSEETELENEASEQLCTSIALDEGDADSLVLPLPDEASVMLGLVFQSVLSDAAQQDVQQMADALNAKIGFEAFSYILSSFWMEKWQTEHESSLNRLNEQLQNAALSAEARAALEAEKQEVEQQNLDPSDLALFVMADCKPTYTAAQLKLVCKTLQKIYDCIHQELDDDQIMFESQRILLDDEHTWAKITLEDDEIIWRDEYCPYEGDFARFLEQICYADYETVFELDQKAAILTAQRDYLKQDANRGMASVCRIRALKFIDLMRNYFDQTIDFSIASLPKAALFLNAVRDSLTQDRKNLCRDASPRMEQMFKQLLKYEDDDGALKLRDYEDVLFQDIMQPLSAWLGEIFRIHCANFEWQAEIEKQDEDRVITVEPVLYNTKTKDKLFPIAFAEKFFYRPDYELNIDDYYYSAVKQLKFEPAVAHEYRFKHLPEDNLPDNILPFQPK